MSIRVFDRNIVDRKPFLIGLLVLDLDPIASRIIITDRETGLTIRHAHAVHSTFYMNLSYVNLSDFLITMIDDSYTYNAVAVDGVKCELIDAVALGL